MSTASEYPSIYDEYWRSSKMYKLSAILWHTPVKERLNKKYQYSMSEETGAHM